MWNSNWLPRLVAQIFAIVPVEEIWQWAAKFVFFDSKAAAEPGNYDPDKTPFTLRLQELVRTPFHNGVRVRKIVVKKSSQSGFSEAVLNCIRWCARFSPRNVIYAIDSREEAVNIRNRLLSTLERLGERILTGDEDDLGKYMLVLRHMIIWFFGSFSAGKFANKQASLCVADEAEEHAVISGDTSTVDNLDSRNKTAEDGMTIVLSKPKLKGGIIDREHRLGNQEIYLVPCPHCGTYQELVNERMKFSHCKNLLGEWDLRRVLNETFMECVGCKQLIEEKFKRWMIHRDRARWFATAVGEPGVISQHISDLYSLDSSVSWGRLAIKIIQSKGNRKKRQGVYNHNFGLEWAEEVSKTQMDDLRRHCKPYKRGTIPFEPTTLLLGGDVGLSYARWVVAAVNETGDLAIVDWGNELHPSEVTAIVHTESWPEAGNPSVRHEVEQGFVDGKYRKEDVYTACLQARGRLWPCAGGGSTRGRQSFAFGQLPTYPKWFGLLTFNDRDFKSELYVDRVKEQTPKIWFPVDAEKDFLEELTNEELVEDHDAPTEGMFTWKRKGPNHYGDCVKVICVGWRFLTRKRRPGDEVAGEKAA